MTLGLTNYALDALYKWLTNGSNAGITADLGLGPFKASGSAGFGAGPAGPQAHIAPDVEGVVGGNQDDQ